MLYFGFVRFSIGAANDISEHYKGNRKYDILTEEIKSTEEMNKPEATSPVQTGKDISKSRGNATLRSTSDICYVDLFQIKHF